MESLKQKTFKGTLWSTLERFSVQGIAFVVMIIMARILTPDDYGLVGMLAVFIAVSQSLVDSGFSQALIRKQDRSEVDNSTVFYFNIGVGIVLYLILFFCAPLIARFYNQPILTPLTRLISLSVLINSFVVVQRALLTVKIDFKTQAKASFSAAIVSGVVGITMAYTGYGVWSIVWYQLTNLTVNVGLLWVFSKWRPKWTYSWNSFRELFKVGSNLAVSGIIDTIYNNIYLIVIGKFYNSSDLGNYTRAQQFAFFPTSNLSNIIQRVTYPTLCILQNEKDIDVIRNAFCKMLRLSCFIIFPVTIGIAALAEPLVLTILNNQWILVVPLLVPLCFSLMWYPVHVINLNLILSQGHSDTILKIEIIKKIVGIFILIFTIPLGVKIMCYGAVLSALISLYINSYYTGIYIKCGFLYQLKAIMPSLLYSFSMGLIVWGISYIFSYHALRLIMGIISGIIYFFTITKLTRSADLYELLSFVKK